MSPLTLVFFYPHGDRNRVRADAASQKHPWRPAHQQSTSQTTPGKNPHSNQPVLGDLLCASKGANVSYESAAADVEFFTGIRIPAKTQQRLVHRQEFSLPAVGNEVKELSVDGGKVRLRTPVGEESAWKDYKAVRLHGQATAAWYRDNATLVEWVLAQPLAAPLACIGDGHDGIWNIIKQLAPPDQRREILDWYHLRENLYKVGGSIKRLHQAQAFLWRGQVDAASELFLNCQLKTCA